MGIVQELRKKIENLEAKNRMLKRMYETQRTETAEAKLEREGAVKVLKCAIAKAGGGVLIDQNDLNQAEKHTVAVCVHKDIKSVEYYIPEIVGDVSEEGAATSDVETTE